MTREELAAIKALADAATPGPWSYTTVKPYATAPASESVAYVSPEMMFGDSVGGGYVDRVADAAFIAAARTAVPALLAEVERLRALVREFLVHEDLSD